MKCQVFFNGEKIYDINYSKPLGALYGIEISIADGGLIDYYKISDNSGRTICFEDFK